MNYNNYKIEELQTCLMSYANKSYFFTHYCHNCTGFLTIASISCPVSPLNKLNIITIFLCFVNNCFLNDNYFSFSIIIFCKCLKWTRNNQYLLVCFTCKIIVASQLQPSQTAPIQLNITQKSYLYWQLSWLPCNYIHCYNGWGQ